MAGRRILTGAAGGTHRATDLGDGLEFADHREYAPGDELRYVDWNVFGRLDRLQIRLFHRHSEQQIHLLLDTSASMGIGRPGKDVFARRCAAGLAYLAWANLDRVSISAWGGANGNEELTPQRGRAGRFASILDYLAGVSIGGQGNLETAARRWAGVRRPRGLAVVVTDCEDLEDLSRALRRIRHHGHQLAVLQVNSPAEAGRVPPGPLAMVNPEGAASPLRLTAEADLLAAYAAEWERHLAHARATVHATGGVHAHATTDENWERFLLNTLRLLRLAAV